MTIKVSPGSEALIRAELESGRYSSAEEVIDVALLEQFSDGGMSYDEVETSLLEAVREPTVPYCAEELKEMVMREVRRSIKP